MDLFRRKKKMTEQEDFNEEMRDEEMTEEIPFTDKRRININANSESSSHQGETQSKKDAKSPPAWELFQCGRGVSGVSWGPTGLWDLAGGNLLAPPEADHQRAAPTDHLFFLSFYTRSVH